MEGKRPNKRNRSAERGIWSRIWDLLFGGVEFDHQQHEGAVSEEADERRTGYRQGRGYRLTWFRDDDFLEDDEGMLEVILESLE